MRNTFTNTEGGRIVLDLVTCIQDNKDYLSEIDGAIGDGDHGINMNKGFSMCGKELEANPQNLSDGLSTLSRILMNDIGGSMGPLYGMFFRAMSRKCSGLDIIDAVTFGGMLAKCETEVRDIGTAEVGDKTMLDALVPAVNAYTEGIQGGKSFADSLEDMKQAAIKGRDSTKDMVARVGRASRLGERSRGVIDAGSASCCLILGTFADSIRRILAE